MLVSDLVYLVLYNIDQKGKIKIIEYVFINFPHGFFSSENQPLVLEDIMKSHVHLVINSDPGYEKNLVNVRRTHCWKDALNKLSKPSFIPERKLSVKFADDMGTSEGAVDEGRPLPVNFCS